MVIKDENKSRKWRVQLSYKDIDGKVKRKQKRGFNSKREAQEWERNFLNSLNTTANITFANLTEAYLNDMKHRLKASTMETKVTLIMQHVQPFFAELEIKNITPLVVRSWQSELLKSSYSKTYIKTINNQLSAILNYAVKYYHLPSNPVHIAGTIGKKKADEMNFWTLEEFNTYISVINSPLELAVFNTLYYGGMRIGELLALTLNDIDFKENTININKTYTMVKGREYVTEPKTPKGNRSICMPVHVMNLLCEYVKTLYKLRSTDRIFTIPRSKPGKWMKKYCKLSNVKLIRLHDLRHSHASLLISLDVNIMTISDRLGHENTQTTWDTYGHLYPNKRKEVAEKLNNAIFTP